MVKSYQSKQISLNELAFFVICVVQPLNDGVDAISKLLPSLITLH